MWSDSQETADLVIFAEEILNGKLHFLCSVTNSIFAPSVVVLSLIYQFLDFIFESPSTTIKCELDSVRVSKVSLKLSLNYSKASLAWLGDR